MIKAVDKMILGDFGTSWTKIHDTSTGKHEVILSRLARDIRADIATGHNAALHSSRVIGELTALVQGGMRLIGDSFLLLDVGGRDMKFVEVQDGKVRRMEWNTQCGAMTGFTLELLGRYFELDFGNISPVEHGYPMTCGVLGLERAFDDMATGVEPTEAVARLAKGIAEAAFRFIGSPPCFHLSGGMCDNPLFLAGFSEPVEIIPLGRFVLVEGLAAEAEQQKIIG